MTNFPNIPPVGPKGEIVLLEQIRGQLDRMSFEQKRSTAATVAAGMIAATGRPHSPKEAAKIVDEVYWALYPDRSAGNYNRWETEGRGDTVHS